MFCGKCVNDAIKYKLHRLDVNKKKVVTMLIDEQCEKIYFLLLSVSAAYAGEFISLSL